MRRDGCALGSGVDWNGALVVFTAGYTALRKGVRGRWGMIFLEISTTTT